MTKLVIRNYWWLVVTKEVGRYVDGCDICQRVKNRTEIPVKKLKLNEILEKLQTYLTINFITKLLIVAGKNTILVVCSRLSKIMYFVVTTEETLAKRLAQLFKDNIWKLHRLLESMMSNRKLQFAAKLTKELNRILDIKIKLSTAFHPQTDRQAE